MSASACLYSRLLANVKTAEARLSEMRGKIKEIRQSALYEKLTKLRSENNTLEVEIQKYKERLIQLETQNGKKQIPLPARSNANVSQVACVEAKSEATSESPKPTEVKTEKKAPEGIKEKKEKAPPKPAAPEAPIDVRRLDLRVGRIVEVNKHPDADSLYVEKINCGEEQPRTVVSGLVNHVPIEEMRDRLVMVLCNLKPVKMRGVTSEAMVMCASSPDKVEVLSPPPGSEPGDLVHCAGYPREPDVQLNPKKKVFETCAPDLSTNDHLVACYKGNPFQVPGKGEIVAKTLKGVPVK